MMAYIVSLLLRDRFLIWASALLLCFNFQPARGQVNTEALRKFGLKNGWYNRISADLGFQSGNSEYLTLKAGLRIDYLHDNYYSFLVLSYQRGTEANELFINKGFVHLRGIYSFNFRFAFEAFTQKEFNDFINLKDRNLLGSGVRLTLLRAQKKSEKETGLDFFLGIGAMWENEKLEDGPTVMTNIFRSTNYISGNWKIDNRVNFNLTSYYQVAVDAISDYRILLESGLGFSLTRSITFKTNVNFRYDNLPPEDVKNYDLELTNGISISI